MGRLPGKSPQAVATGGPWCSAPAVHRRSHAHPPAPPNGPERAAAPADLGLSPRTEAAPWCERPCGLRLSIRCARPASDRPQSPGQHTPRHRLSAPVGWWLAGPGSAPTQFGSNGHRPTPPQPAHERQTGGCSKGRSAWDKASERNSGEDAGAVHHRRTDSSTRTTQANDSRVDHL